MRPVFGLPRSSFCDWAAEQTNFPREVAAAALAHAIQSRVEAAYRRSDLFDKRRLLMDKWAWHCQQEQSGSSGKVLEMTPTTHKAKKK